MTRTPSQCAHCGKWRLKEVGAVNRAARLGAPLYCGKECSGVARRSCKTVEQRREEKAAYDARRRIELRDGLKAKKAAYHKRTYDPVPPASPETRAGSPRLSRLSAPSPTQAEVA